MVPERDESPIAIKRVSLRLVEDRNGTAGDPPDGSRCVEAAAATRVSAVSIRLVPVPAQTKDIS